MPNKPTMRVVDVMGMPMEVWSYESCMAEIASVDDWATVYGIHSATPSKGHATELLKAAKEHYESQGKRFGGSVALNDRMRKIYQRLGIVEYDDAYMSSLEGA